MNNPNRVAYFDINNKSLRFWLTPNMCGERRCGSLSEARKLVKDTGVQQKLRIEEDA